LACCSHHFIVMQHTALQSLCRLKAEPALPEWLAM
jgi:hypothetical protein